MAKSRVEQLADEIKDEEHRSELGPVRAIIDPRQGYTALQTEIMSEMANALGRAERKVTQAIEQLAKLAPGSDEWEAQREAALAARRDLSIHREALRFPRDPRFEQQFPIPPSPRRRRG